MLSQCVVYNGAHQCVDNYYAPPKINYIVHAVRKICVYTMGVRYYFASASMVIFSFLKKNYVCIFSNKFPIY